MTQKLVCFSCGIGIGPDYECRSPSWAGDKPLCGHCDGKMKSDGYIQIDDLHRLLPDGSIIKFRRILPWLKGVKDGASKR